MKYQSILINNFRAFSELQISSLKRINVFVGENNTGKSTILEAFFLLSGMSNPQLPVNIHLFRDMKLFSDNDFKYLFKDLNFEKPVKLSGFIGKKNRSAELTPVFEKNLGTEVNTIQEPVAVYGSEMVLDTGNEIDIKGIRINFSGLGLKKTIVEFSVNKGEVKFDPSYKEKIPCRYLNSKSLLDNLDRSLENMIIGKKIEDIVKVLKHIEPEIQDIRLGTNGRIFVDIAKEELFPLSIMGDGIKKIIAVIASIASVKNGILLIDEIENGLHHSSLKYLWQAILTACEFYKVQLITTTHSYECISALVESAHKINDYKEEISLYRIEKKNQEHKINYFDLNMLTTGLENNFELR